MRSIRELARKAGIGRGKLRCSFCGRDADEVGRLIAGANGHICDECVAECVKVLDDHGGFDAPQRNRKH
jgi:hypothetical protein